MSFLLFSGLISWAGMFFTAVDSAVVETAIDDSVILPFVLNSQFHSNGLIPRQYEVLDSLSVDITGDGLSEEIYLIKRRFRDWPFSKYFEMESRIAQNQDEDSMSCSVFVFGRKFEGDSSQSFLWGGSPMYIPFISIEPYDFEGDGIFEIAAAESEYSLWGKNVATSIGIWKWDVFGFRRVCSSSRNSINCAEFEAFMRLDETMILRIKLR